MTVHTVFMEDAKPSSPNSSSTSSSTEEEWLDVNNWSSDLEEDDQETDEKNWSNEFANRLLNFRSPLFSPSLAIRLDSTQCSSIVPDPSAPLYLNLTQYSKAVPSPDKSPNRELELKPVNLKKAPPTTTLTSTGTTNMTTEKQMYPIPGRRFLPHQLPTYSPRVEAPNTMKIMQTIEGPLSALRTAMEKRRRVKVWTRGASSLRGYLTGFIEVFDKHWNLGMKNVDEVFQRKRNIKYPHFKEQDSVKKKNNVSADAKIVIPPNTSKKRSNTRSSSKFKVSRKSSNIFISGESEDLVSLCRLGLQNLSLEDHNCRTLPETTKSFRRKHGLMIFKKPLKDANGFTIVGQSKKMELVQRHVGQLFVMGNDIVLIETDKGIR